MSCSAIMFSLFLTSPCPQGGSADVNEAVANAIANPQRPQKTWPGTPTANPQGAFLFRNQTWHDGIRDVLRQWLLHRNTGLTGRRNGKVIAHNNEAYMSFVGEAHQKRHADGRLANTETILSEANDLEFEENSLDAALLVLTWHDFLFADEDKGWPAIDRTCCRTSCVRR